MYSKVPVMKCNKLNDIRNFCRIFVCTIHHDANVTVSVGSILQPLQSI